MAACRCQTSGKSRDLETHGFVCAGHNGNRAHWLCRNCVGPRNTCLDHPGAAVVPVRGLWADTRFRPQDACAPPRLPLPTTTRIDSSGICVQHGGAKGYLFHLKQPARQPHAVIIKAALRTAEQSRRIIERYAVVWPGHPSAWMFPRLIDTAPAGSQRQVAVEVMHAECWPAWTPDNKLLGLPPDLVGRIMGSACARTRWWFMMPRTDPPLTVPAKIRSNPAAAAPDLGHCDVPAQPYPAALETVRRQNGSAVVRCAWCKQVAATRTEWRLACAPDCP